MPRIRVCFPKAHALKRLQERGATREEIIRRIHRMVEDWNLIIDRRMRVALVGEEPPVLVDFRPPNRATVVTVLPKGGGVTGVPKFQY